MTQGEFHALEKLLDRLTIQVNSVSAEVGELKSGQALIEQRLDSENAAAARETELVKALSNSEKAAAARESEMMRMLAGKDSEMKEQMAKRIVEITESQFRFHLRVLTALVTLLAVASFPQLITVWKTLKGFRP